MTTHQLPPSGPLASPGVPESVIRAMAAVPGIHGTLGELAADLAAAST